MLQTSQLEGFYTVPPIGHLRVSGQVRHHPQSSPVLLPTHLPLPFPPPEASPPFPSPHFCGFSNLILVSPHTSGRKNSPLFSAVQTDSYLPNLTLTPQPPTPRSLHLTPDRQVGGRKKPNPKGVGKGGGEASRPRALPPAARGAAAAPAAPRHAAMPCRLQSHSAGAPPPLGWNNALGTVPGTPMLLPPSPPPCRDPRGCAPVADKAGDGLRSVGLDRHRHGARVCRALSPRVSTLPAQLSCRCWCGEDVSDVGELHLSPTALPGAPRTSLASAVTATKGSLHQKKKLEKKMLGSSRDASPPQPPSWGRDSAPGPRQRLSQGSAISKTNGSSQLTQGCHRHLPQPVSTRLSAAEISASPSDL